MTAVYVACSGEAIGSDLRKCNPDDRLARLSATKGDEFVCSKGEWSTDSLTELLLAAGYAGELHRRIGVLFRSVAPTPTPDRAGAVEHPTTACLAWRGSSVRAGYGFVRADGRMRQVHSVVYELTTGLPAPTAGDPIVLGHRCEYRLCAHPDHVRPITHAENVGEAARNITYTVTDVAPEMACRACGAAMTPGIQLRGDNRPAWTYRCNPCNRAYAAARRSPGYVSGTLWSGQATRPMTDDECAAVAIPGPRWRQRGAITK